MGTYKFTCNNCGLAFTSGEDQRQHMKTEWHRYNLKRRVAKLPPISEAMFNEKVANVGAEDGNGADDTANHDLSKKEKRKKAKAALLEKKKQLLDLARKRIAGKGGEVKITEDGKLIIIQKPIGNEQKKLEEGITKDEEVLMGDNAHLSAEQMQEKIMEDKIKNKVDIPTNVCMFCGIESENLESNIEHMQKKHGFYIPEQKFLVDKKGLIEYLGEKIGLGNICLTCNYQGKSLESIRQHMLAKDHCKIPYDTEDEQLEISKFYDFSSSYNDNGSEGTIYASEIGLHLPNGLIAGDRALERIWRQNLPPERHISEGQGTVMAAETRNNLTNTFDEKKFKETKRTWIHEKKDQKVQEKRRAKFINVKPHYRDELLQ